MINSPSAIMEQLLEILNGWKNLGRDDKFADMTFEEFQTEIAKSIDIRGLLTDLDQQTVDATRRRESIDAANWALAKLVVDSVRGSRKHGRNSALYKAMGYIPDDERATGLTRKKKHHDDDENPDEEESK